MAHKFDSLLSKAFVYSAKIRLASSDNSMAQLIKLTIWHYGMDLLQ